MQSGEGHIAAHGRDETGPDSRPRGQHTIGRVILGALRGLKERRKPTPEALRVADVVRRNFAGDPESIECDAIFIRPLPRRTPLQDITLRTLRVEIRNHPENGDSSAGAPCALNFYVSINSAHGLYTVSILPGSARQSPGDDNPERDTALRLLFPHGVPPQLHTQNNRPDGITVALLREEAMELSERTRMPHARSISPILLGYNWQSMVQQLVALHDDQIVRPGSALLGVHMSGGRVAEDPMNTVR